MLPSRWISEFKVKPGEFQNSLGYTKKLPGSNQNTNQMKD